MVKSKLFFLFSFFFLNETCEIILFSHFIFIALLGQNEGRHEEERKMNLYTCSSLKLVGKYIDLPWEVALKTKH